MSGFLFSDEDQSRLAAWEHVGPKCQVLVERVLAAQGDRAEPDLVQLQHDLSQLNSSAPQP